MNMSATLTRSNTFSEARARDVMLEVGADFYAVAAAGLISWDDAQKWTEEISFILIHQAAIRFQIQLQCQGYAPRASNSKSSKFLGFPNRRKNDSAWEWRFYRPFSRS